MTPDGEPVLLVAASPALCLFLCLSFAFPLSRPFSWPRWPSGCAPASADTGDVYVHAGANFKPVTVAVTPFVGEEGGDKIGGIVSNDFARSIFLLPVNPASFPETISNPDVRPNVDAWKTVNAQFVLTGRVLRPDNGHVTAQFRLWDASTGEQVAGEQYTTEAANARRVAHMIADSVFSRVTGEKGFFDSRVVFVDETGPKEKRRKRLAVMDMDGANVKTLGGGDGLVVTPRFSPSAQQVAYMSFGSADPKVTLLNLETGQREAVGNFPGMTFAPRFSPDGQQIVMSLSEGANSNLYTMDLRTRATTRLTDTSAIDTSPTFSPDGSQIAFESDRGGSQQIYVMSSTRRPGQAHFVRRRKILDAGLVAARRSHRLHPHQGRLVRHRRDEARRLGRADPGRRLP